MIRVTALTTLAAGGIVPRNSVADHKFQMRCWCADECSMRGNKAARLALASLAVTVTLIAGACSDDGGTQTSGTSIDGSTTTGPITGMRDRTQGAVDGLNDQQNQLDEETGSGDPSY